METHHRVSIMRGVVEYVMALFNDLRRQDPFGGLAACLQLPVAAGGGHGREVNSAIPQTSTGSRNDRRIPDDAVADGPGGALPATGVHNGAQPGLSAQVRGGVDESSGRRTSIRRGGHQDCAGREWRGRARHDAAGSPSGRIAFRILRIGVRQCTLSS